jgi:hypothetical protein
MILKVAFLAYLCFIRHFFSSKVLIDYAIGDIIKMPAGFLYQFIIKLYLHQGIFTNFL